MMETAANRATGAEGRHHRYVGNDIPWFVHVLWVLFWLFAVGYLITYQLPELRREFQKPQAAEQPAARTTTP